MKAKIVSIMLCVLFVACHATSADEKSLLFDKTLKSAELGNADAMNLLGAMYREGKGVPQDYAKAVMWFEKSAELGNSNAMGLLGEMYRDGEGVPQDYAKAHMWYNLSSSLGYTDSRKERDDLSQMMSDEQIFEAQKLASDWMESYESRQSKKK